MAQVTVTRSVGKKFAESIDPVKVPNFVLASAQRIIKSGLRRVIKDANANYVPRDLGALKASGRIETSRINGVAISRVVYGGPSAPHALFVHEGTMAPRRAPPPHVLLAWVLRHFAVERTEAKQIAYFIGRKIARKGTPATKFLEIPFRKERKKLNAKLRNLKVGPNAFIG